MTDTSPLSSVQPSSSLKDGFKIQDNILWSCRKKNVRKGPQMKIRSITSQPSRQQSRHCVSLKEHFVILFLSKCLSLAISQNLFNSHFAIYSYCYCYKRIFDSADTMYMRLYVVYMQNTIQINLWKLEISSFWEVDPLKNSQERKLSLKITRIYSIYRKL
jgi:hypothetical protein